MAVATIQVGMMAFATSAASADPLTNLLGPNGSASIQLLEQYTGAINGDVSIGLSSIYNRSGLADGAVVTAAAVNCGPAIWLWEQLLCDPPPATDQPGTISAARGGVGATFSNNISPDYYGFYVVDLGGTRAFSSLEVYQMFSDGKVTHVEMAVNSSVGDVRPAWNAAGWVTALPKTVVPAGANTVGPPYEITEPGVYSLGSQRGRYVLLKFWNDGGYGWASWLEVGGVKLFGLTTEVSGSIAEPPPIQQQVGRPAGGCSAVVDDSLNWGGSPSGGWRPSWVQWPNEGLGGDVCTRTLKWTSSGTWTHER